jgi:hypothetical protein
MSDQLRGNALVNDALGSALRRGGDALGTVPPLLKRVLDDGSWREFVTKRDERVHHERFADFVTAKPLAGLGVDMALIDRIVGTSDPDLLRMLREARKLGAGRRTDLEPEIESIVGSLNTGRAEAAAERLAREAPDEYAAVQRGEKTINAAAVSAGIRRRRVSVRLDSAESAAETLRKHMAPGELARLRELLGK